VDSALSRFLLRRALTKPRLIGHIYYWLLQSEVYNVDVSKRYVILLQVRFCVLFVLHLCLFVRHPAVRHHVSLPEAFGFLDCAEIRAGSYLAKCFVEYLLTYKIFLTTAYNLSRSTHRSTSATAARTASRSGTRCS
jgi:hypothetical protein